MTPGRAAVIPDRVVRQHLDAERLVSGLLLAVFGLFLYVFLVWPMAQVLWRSLLDNDGRFVGPANYLRYFRTPAIAASITNSLTVSLIAMVLTVGLAFVYAYALTRTRMPGRGLFRVVAMLPIFTGAGDAIHFSTLVIPLAFVKEQATSSVIAAPMNSNFRASNSIPGWPRTWPIMSGPLNLATVSPSGLATL